MKRRLLPLLLVSVPLLAGGPAVATAPSSLEAANRLMGACQYEAANQKFTQARTDAPTNADAWFGSGYCLYLESIAQADPKIAIEERKQAYLFMAKAKELHSTDPLLLGVLSEIDANGSLIKKSYSQDPRADAAIQEAEKAFAGGDFDGAIAGYQKALSFDPKNYSAALFTGDCYFRKNSFNDAITWFEKATKIDPDQETAYRYWGDALAHQQRAKEALDKYIDAVIAQPYARYSRPMLERVGRDLGMPMQHPVNALPRVNLTTKDGAVTIDYDTQGDPMVLAYTTARAAWLDTPGNLPKGAVYRHSLAEECAGLRQFAETVHDMEKSGGPITSTWSPTAGTLRSLDKAGLLEAYVLLDRPDRGIAADYVNYRRLHRELLERYAHEVWFPDVPEAAAAPGP